jgi:hypothetical protein
MDAKLSGILLICCLSLSLLLPSVNAVDVIESQEDITLTLERDSCYEFPLMLQNVDEITTVESAGEIDGWITFWGKDDHEYDIYPGQSYVLVYIDVPEKADLGEYEGEIKAGTKTLTEIRVKVTLDLSTVIANEEVADLHDKVGTLTDDVAELRNQVATLEHTVTQKVEEIQKYQKDLAALEDEKDALEKEHAELSEDYEELEENYNEAAESNEELSALTGAMVGVHLPSAIVGGIILGVLLVTAIIRRELVKKKLKNKLKSAVGRSEHRDEFRYSFKK